MTIKVIDVLALLGHRCPDTYQLIQDFFADRRPPVFTSGSGLVLQIENCLRRSQIETPRFETKQGFLSLDAYRQWNKDLEQKIVETACGIANLAEAGDIFIGVADKLNDAKKVQNIDGVNPLKIGKRYVVGVEREAKLLDLDIEGYMRRIVDVIRNSDLSAPLKDDLLGSIDAVDFKGLSIIRISINLQSSVSFVGTRCFTREGSETKEVTGPAILALQERFDRKTRLSD